MGVHDGVAQILQARRQPDIAHEILARLLIEEAAARIGAEPSQSLQNFVRADLEVVHFERNWCYPILPNLTANTDEGCDPGHGEHLWPQDKVGDLPQLHSGGGSRLGGQSDQQDFTHDRGEGCHLRHDASRQLRLDHAEAFVDAHARQRDVGRPFELGDHHREANSRGGAHSLDARGPAKQAFDRPRDERAQLPREPSLPSLPSP